MKSTTCCFIGHRTINETEELKNRLTETIERLILKENVDTFLFGSKSRFNDLCYELVTEIKGKHPHIKRIYVRAEFPEIDDDYKNYLLKLFENTYYPEKIIGSGKAVYVERNCEMITNSRFVIIYYNEEETPSRRKSGTRISYEYAVKCGKEIFRFPC